DYFDKKKNWLVESQMELSDDEVLKELFQIQEFDPDVAEKKKRKAMERYFDDPEKQGPNERARRQNEREEEEEEEQFRNNNTMPAHDGSLLSGDKGRNQDLNFSTFLTPNRNTDLALPASSLNRFSLSPQGAGSLAPLAPGGARIPKTPETDLRAQEFRKLLEPRAPGMAGMLGVLDPINMHSDATRQELNPVIPRTFSDQNFLSGSPRLDSLPNGNSGIAPPRPNVFDSLNSNAKVLGGSSLAPAVIVPTPPTVMQPKPVILEIPRRKF
ncbi:MAG: hypothetical protein AB1813_10690, partial [Verrucomicrobiota bacterium]